MSITYVINTQEVFKSDLIFSDPDLYKCRTDQLNSKNEMLEDIFKDDGSIPLKAVELRRYTKQKDLYDIFNAPHNRYVLHLFLQTNVNNLFLNPQNNTIVMSKQQSPTPLTLKTYNIRLLCKAKNACLKLLMIHHLKHHVHARLGKSNFGVGVFAIRDIAKGMPIFDNLLTKCATYNPVTIDANNVKQVNSRVKSGKTPIESLLADFFLQSGKQITYPVPVYGPNSIDTSFYLNHSETPNLTITYPEYCDMSVYVAARQIDAGEELSIDYTKFGFKQEEIQQRMPFLTTSIVPTNKKRCLQK